MNSIIITPKNKREFKLLSELLAKMNVSAKTLSDEEKEDFGMAMLMKEADRSQKVARETVMEKLRSR